MIILSCQNKRCSYQNVTFSLLNYELVVTFMPGLPPGVYLWAGGDRTGIHLYPVPSPWELPNQAVFILLNESIA